MSRSGLQYLETQGFAVDGTAVDIPTALDRRTEQVFLTGAGVAPGATAIAVGDWVALDASGSTDSARAISVVKAAAVGNGNTLVVGVALEAADSEGAKIKVVTRGYVERANVLGGTTLGTALVVDTTAGQAQAIAAGDLAPACGVALEAAPAVGPDADTCDVYVYSNFYTG